MHVTVNDVSFCGNLECVKYKSTKAVHQQHVNCLIKTWVFFRFKKWLLIVCNTAFYAIITFKRIKKKNTKIIAKVYVPHYVQSSGMGLSVSQA